MLPLMIVTLEALEYVAACDVWWYCMSIKIIFFSFCANQHVRRSPNPPNPPVISWSVFVASTPVPTPVLHNVDAISMNALLVGYARRSSALIYTSVFDLNEFLTCNYKIWWLHTTRSCALLPLVQMRNGYLWSNFGVDQRHPVLAIPKASEPTSDDDELELRLQLSVPTQLMDGNSWRAFRNIPNDPALKAADSSILDTHPIHTQHPWQHEPPSNFNVEDGANVKTKAEY